MQCNAMQYYGGEYRTCGTAVRGCGQNPRGLQHELLETARASARQPQPQLQPQPQPFGLPEVWPSDPGFSNSFGRPESIWFSIKVLI